MRRVLPIIGVCAAVGMVAACGQERRVSIDQTPEPARSAILAEAAGDPIVKIVTGSYGGKQCFTVAVERPSRTSWFSVDASGRPCQ